MRFTRERNFLIAFAMVLVAAAVLTLRQFIENQSRHAELREAFIFLYNKGYSAEAQRLYTKLTWNLRDESTRHLIEDLQRTSAIAPTNQNANTNILVRYHISVRRELDQRFEEQYLKARKLAGEDSR